MTTQSPKKALITGITGQDGAYLARLLLDKGYIVHGLQRRASNPNTQRIEHLIGSNAVGEGRLILHHSDMDNMASIARVLKICAPDEIYNLAAQSHVQVSFESPEHTANTNGLGVTRLLDAMRLLGMEKTVRFYQASTSEMYGSTKICPQDEQTPFTPCNPYAAAKLYAYWMTVNYRNAYGMFASNGILFNHESPLRGETFVTRKISKGVAGISLGLNDCLYLGNLDAKRDWGHARDYVEGMWRILQHDRADDFVLATGKTSSVRNFVELAFAQVGIHLAWTGKGLEETGIDRKNGNILVRVDAKQLRPLEVDFLQGDASKAQRELGWTHKTPLEDLVREMVFFDIEQMRPDTAFLTLTQETTQHNRVSL